MGISGDRAYLGAAENRKAFSPLAQAARKDSAAAEHPPQIRPNPFDSHPKNGPLRFTNSLLRWAAAPCGFIQPLRTLVPLTPSSPRTSREFPAFSAISFDLEIDKRSPRITQREEEHDTEKQRDRGKKKRRRGRTAPHSRRTASSSLLLLHLSVPLSLCVARCFFFHPCNLRNPWTPVVSSSSRGLRGLPLFA